MYVRFILLLLLPIVLGGKRTRPGKKVRMGGMSGRKKKNYFANPVEDYGQKSFEGHIEIVSPDFVQVKDAYGTFIGTKLRSPGTSSLFGNFIATFFFTPFRGNEAFDGTCTIEDAAGNVIHAAFFGANILFPSDAKGNLTIPMKAHIFGGDGLYDDARGTLEFDGTIQPKNSESGFGPTHFFIKGFYVNGPKSATKQTLLNSLKSVTLDGWASSKVVQGNEVKVNEDGTDSAVVTTLEGYGREQKFGNFALSIELMSYEPGFPFDGTFMMKMENGDALNTVFFDQKMVPTNDGYSWHLTATIIGGYGKYSEAKGAIFLKGLVKTGENGGISEIDFSMMEGDIITEGIINEWNERGQKDHLRGKLRLER